MGCKTEVTLDGKTSFSRTLPFYLRYHVMEELLCCEGALMFLPFAIILLNSFYMQASKNSVYQSFYVWIVKAVLYTQWKGKKVKMLVAFDNFIFLRPNNSKQYKCVFFCKYFNVHYNNVHICIKKTVFGF